MLHWLGIISICYYQGILLKEFGKKVNVFFYYYFDLGVKILLILFSYFSLKFDCSKRFCFLFGTDVAQFLFGFLSNYSQSVSLINLNAIFNQQWGTS